MIAGEEAGRPGADDHRPMPQGVCPGLGPVKAIRNVQLDGPARARLHASEVTFGKIDGRGIGEVNVVVAAGVEALADDPPAEIESVATASLPAIFSGRLSSGSPSSRRIFVTLIDMAS